MAILVNGEWRDDRFAELDRLIALEELERLRQKLDNAEESTSTHLECLKWHSQIPPETQGYIDGRNNRHYCPHLDFNRSEDWIAWFRGWRRGQAEYRRRVSQ